MRVALRRTDLLPALLLVAGLAIAALSLVILIGRPDKSTLTIIEGPQAEVSAEISGTISFWEQRVAADPDDFIAHRKLAGSYLRRARETGDVADYTRAEVAVLASLDASRGDNYTATVLLASIHNTKHEFTDAIVTARQAIEIDPDEPFGYAVLGDAQLALGHYEEALRNYERIVTTAPGLTSFSRLAHALELLGDVDGAQLAWLNALGTDGGQLPENTAWAHAQLGDFQFRIGKVDDARANYRLSLESVPSFVPALRGLANVHAARGDYDEAVGLYETVVERRPELGSAATLGDLYAAIGNSTAAAKQYDLVLAISNLYQANGINTDLEVALFLANHQLDPDEAVRQAQAVYDSQPDSIYAADALAWALHRGDRTKEARAYSEQATRLGTPDPMLYFHAGVIAEAGGDVDAARQYFARADELNPRFSVLHADTLSDALNGLAVSR